MSSNCRIAIGFNPIISVREMVRIATHAESKGLDSVWIHESLYQRDVISYISSISYSTRRIRIGSGVMNTYTRHPVLAASTFATLSELSGGRVILGVGLGSFPTIPQLGYRIFPVSETRPLQRIKEYVTIVKEVLSGEEVNFNGKFFSVKGLKLGFNPPRVPLFIASLSPLTLEYAGANVDGAILSPAINTIEGTKRLASYVRRGEEKRGRKVEVASYILTCLDEKPEDAISKIRNYYFFAYQFSEVVRFEDIEPYGIKEDAFNAIKQEWKKGRVEEVKKMIPEAIIRELALVGKEDLVIDKIKEYRKAGVTLPILMPISEPENTVNKISSLITSGVIA